MSNRTAICNRLTYTNRNTIYNNISQQYPIYENTLEMYDVLQKEWANVLNGLDSQISTNTACGWTKTTDLIEQRPTIEVEEKDQVKINSPYDFGTEIKDCIDYNGYMFYLLNKKIYFNSITTEGKISSTWVSWDPGTIYGTDSFVAMQSINKETSSDSYTLTDYPITYNFFNFFKSQDDVLYILGNGTTRIKPRASSSPSEHGVELGIVIKLDINLQNANPININKIVLLNGETIGDTDIDFSSGWFQPNSSLELPTNSISLNYLFSFLVTYKNASVTKHCLLVIPFINNSSSFYYDNNIKPLQSIYINTNLSFLPLGGALNNDISNNIYAYDYYIDQLYRLHRSQIQIVTSTYSSTGYNYEVKETSSSVFKTNVNNLNLKNKIIINGNGYYYQHYLYGNINNKLYLANDSDTLSPIKLDTSTNNVFVDIYFQTENSINYIYCLGVTPDSNYKLFISKIQDNETSLTSVKVNNAYKNYLNIIDIDSKCVSSSIITNYLCFYYYNNYFYIYLKKNNNTYLNTILNDNTPPSLTIADDTILCSYIDYEHNNGQKMRIGFVKNLQNNLATYQQAKGTTYKNGFFVTYADSNTELDDIASEVSICNTLSTTSQTYCDNTYKNQYGFLSYEIYCWQNSLTPTYNNLTFVYTLILDNDGSNVSFIQSNINTNASSSALLSLSITGSLIDDNIVYLGLSKTGIDSTTCPPSHPNWKTIISNDATTCPCQYIIKSNENEIKTWHCDKITYTSNIDGSETTGFICLTPTQMVLGISSALYLNLIIGKSNAILYPLQLCISSSFKEVKNNQENGLLGQIDRNILCYSMPTPKDNSDNTIQNGYILDNGNYIYIGENLCLGWDSEIIKEYNPFYLEGANG